MYIDATGSNPDEFARFESPILSPTPDKCVIFFYHMYGGAVNQLTLNTRNTSGVGVCICIDLIGSGRNILINTISGFSFRIDVHIFCSGFG